MAHTDTAVQTAGIAFQGVWVHDPADPIDTVRQFVYGKSARSASIALETQGHNYAGRTFPVYDYGDADRRRWVVEPPKNPRRTEFQRDRARVLHSAALHIRGRAEMAPLLPRDRVTSE